VLNNQNAAANLRGGWSSTILAPKTIGAGGVGGVQMQTTPLSKQHGTASWLPSCASGIDGTQRTAGLYSDLGVFFSVGGGGAWGIWCLVSRSTAHIWYDWSRGYFQHWSALGNIRVDHNNHHASS